MRRIEVRSHVGRDLLSSAAPFKNEAAAIWEYVANSLQYVEAGTAPVVQVAVNVPERQIKIGDNGRGMSAAELNDNFFQLHAENVDRRSGRPGRGKFGTGKSAAFGIGNSLTVDTTQRGVRNVVQLTRSAIDASDGAAFPVTWLVQDERTDLPNGTTIVIADIFLAKIRSNEIAEYIERNLQAFVARQPTVAVNDYVCEYRPPEVVTTRTFVPTPAQEKVLGKCLLTVKVSRVPLSDLQQGIFVTAGPDNHVGTEDCGVAKKEFGNYLFGEIDVPALEAFETPVQPFDDSRSGKLNPEHPVVRTLLGFLGAKLEEVRQEQARAARDALKTEQMRRLAQEADKIAEFLNKDFERLRERLDHIRSASASRGPARSLFGANNAGDASADSWTKGTLERGTIIESTAPSSNGNGKGRKPPTVAPDAVQNPSGKQAIDPVGGIGNTRRPRGGFQVRYVNLGPDQHRSRYDPTGLIILINLDHPAVANALKKSNAQDAIFRRLSYEIAFSEYAMAFGHELIRQDPDIPSDDLLFDVRATLNRVSRAAASLYVG